MDEHFQILKFLADVKGRIDMVEFAQKVGLTSAQTITQLQVMAEEGFLKKVGGGYGMTEKGKDALKAVKAVLATMRFQFYIGIGQPTGESAGNIQEFYSLVLKSAVRSLDFHLYRGDFENWVREAVNDDAFADDLAGIKKHELKGEELKNAIIKAAQARYSL